MPRPNILLIFTDQQRADTIHAAGNPNIATPQLDRLVREGVHFRSAYTPSPVCVPARCSLVYGQYPHKTRCTDNRDPMPTDRPSLMQALSAAGYRTHGIGKMHFTPDSQALRGFQTREHQEEIRESSMLDVAARIPLIARYPRAYAGGQVCDTPVSLVDILPTCLAAAGVDPVGLDTHGLNLAKVAAPQSGAAHWHRTVYSQFQGGPLGVYMALNSRWKFFYSAPDRREFLFDRVHDPEELRSRAGLAFCTEAQRQMREGLFAFYRDEGYAEPLEGRGWRLYPQPSLPVDPDAGLLIQDPGWSLSYQAIPGYTEGCGQSS